MKTVTLADWKPTEKQIQNVNKVLKSGRLTYGPFTRKLESLFAEKHGFKYAIFMNSGTSALQVAWHYLKNKHGWEDGYEVIVPAVTFVATVNMILVNNLKPILVDVDPETFNLDPKLIEKAITSKTVAICPVDLLGRPCDIQAIKKIAKKHNLVIVEDSCETMFVSHSKGKPVGSQADIAVYSSYLAHIISTGVGGFLCTNNKKDADWMRSMIWHGRDNLYLDIDANKTEDLKKLIKARFRFDKIGFSFRLTELEAAIGIDEVKRSENIINTRIINAMILDQYLLDFSEYLELPRMDGPNNAWMFYPVICKEKINRDDLVLFLEQKGVQTRSIMPLTNQSVYDGMWREGDYPVAMKINERGFLLGVHHFLKEKDIKYIAKCLEEYFEGERDD